MFYLIFYLITFGCYLLEVCTSRHNERQNGSGYREVRGDGEELGSGRRKTVFRSYCIRKNMLNKRGEGNLVGKELGGPLGWVKLYLETNSSMI